MLYIITRVLKKVIDTLYLYLSNISAIVLIKSNNIKFGNGLKSGGIPNIDIWRNGMMTIGENFKMNNGERYNRIGRQQKCNFLVMHHAILIIGNSVGISSTSFVCSEKIVIGDFVKIEGDTVIYDTDFHSLISVNRKDKIRDIPKTAPVIIGNNVFIGAHSTILKDVKIGQNAIVGACSLVSKNIPANEIWGGNPAVFNRKCI